MKPAFFLGVVLIVLSILSFAYQGDHVYNP